MNETFGQRLRELREKEHMRQLDLGEMMGIAPNTISSWERENSLPSIYELKALAQIFGVTTDYLLGLAEF